MLRRWIPLMFVAVFVAVGLMLIADSATAGPLKRSRGRDCCSCDCAPAKSCPTSTCCPSNCCEPVKHVAYLPATTVKDGQPVTVMVEERPMYDNSSRRRGFLRRGWANSSPTYYYVAQSGTNPPTSGYRAYYRLPTPEAPAGTVLFNIWLPADAQLWFDGEKTAQAGNFRQFVTPQLTEGKNYSYMIKAQWTENNKQVVRNRKVMVHAGERVDVDLLRATPEELRAPAPVTEQ